MIGVKYKTFTSLLEMVTFMNTVAVSTVVQIVKDDTSACFVLFYQ